MENRKHSTFRILATSTAALAALSLVAIPAAEAHPIHDAPAPPAVRARVVRPGVPAIPAPPVVRVRPTPGAVRVVTLPATLPANARARAQARLAALRAQLTLTDGQCATLEPYFVQATLQAQAIRAQGPMNAERQQALRVLWQGLNARVQATLTVPQRARWAQSRGQHRGWMQANDRNDACDHSWRGEHRRGFGNDQGRDHERNGRDGRNGREGRDGRDRRNDRDGRDGRGQGNGRTARHG